MVESLNPETKISAEMATSSQADEQFVRNWLTWLVKVRAIILTLLFAIELAILNLTNTSVNTRVFVAVIIVCYTVSVFLALLAAQWQETRLHSRLNVLTDLAIATALVYVTGGIDSSFNFLYPLIIIVGSIILSRRWSFIAASVACILYGGMLELTYFDLIRSYGIGRPDAKSLQVAILINFFAYFAIAYLASLLSAKLRQADTELKDKSGELEDLQALHEDIIQSISSGLITTDVMGRVSVVNAAAQRLLDKPAKEMLGCRVGQLFLDQLPAPGQDALRCEVRASCPNQRQKTKTFGMTASQLTVADRGLVGFIYTFEDLTEIRRLEREVRLRDRLAAVGRLAAGIAHEIRNPLSSIAGSVKMLSDVAVLSDEQKMLIDIVKRESERLNSIISDFLTYTREKQYQFGWVELVKLLDEMLTLLEKRMPAMGPTGEELPMPDVKIVRNFSVPEAFTIADADRLKQVFWNICNNALRAMPDGGTLTVSLGGSDSEWAISFCDTGKGIPKQHIDKIFEPFQSHFSGGTGLGLAIVYQIIQAHDGRISVRSGAGEGADFVFYLKRSAEKEATQPAEGTTGKQPALAAGA